MDRSTRESSASVISSNVSKSRGARRQKKGGKIRAGRSATCAFGVNLLVCLFVVFDSPCVSLCMQSRGGNGPCGASQGDGDDR